MKIEPLDTLNFSWPDLIDSWPFYRMVRAESTNETATLTWYLDVFGAKWPLEKGVDGKDAKTEFKKKFSTNSNLKVDWIETDPGGLKKVNSKRKKERGVLWKLSASISDRLDISLKKKPAWTVLKPGWQTFGRRPRRRILLRRCCMFLFFFSDSFFSSFASFPSFIRPCQNCTSAAQHSLF